MRLFGWYGKRSRIARSGDLCPWCGAERIDADWHQEARQEACAACGASLSASPMRGAEAEQVVNVYGAVMADAFSACSLVSESRLPYDKATIKRAILSLMVDLRGSGGLDDAICESLATGYACLADFVDDKAAWTATRWEEMLKLAHSDPEALDTVAGDAYVQAKRRVIQDFQVLLDEFRQFESALRSRERPG